MGCASMLFCIFCFAGTLQDPGPGLVKGIISDATTHEPLAGVHVMLESGRGTSTDSGGMYRLTAEPGIHTLSFSFVGYSSEKKEFIIKSNDSLDITISLKPGINAIDQVVVSASRTDQKISELTVSVDIIRPNEIAKNHITSAEELLDRSPGIEVFDGQASVRGGSGFSYGAGSRVLALIDGLPVLSADAGSIRWQFLPFENLSQIEIIKGASSVLYGSSALNGIINFRSADAGPHPLTQFYSEIGVYDRPSRKNWVWWDHPRFFSSLSFSHLQNYGNTEIGIGSSFLSDEGYRYLNEEKLGRLNLKIKHSGVKKKGLSYGFNLNTGYTSKTDFVLWENADSGALRQDRTTAEKMQGSFLALDPFIRLKQQNTSVHELKMRLQTSKNDFPDNSRNNSDARTLYTEYQSSFKLIEKLSVTAGLSEDFSRIISPFYGDHKALTLAGFGQIELRAVRKLKITGGIRAEHYSLDGEPGKLVPIFRAGLNYQAADFTFIRASFGQGYRYPSIAEKYANTTLGSVSIYPSPDIKPESGWSSELGLKQGILSGRINGQADLALFYSQNSRMVEYLFGLYPDPRTSEFNYGFKAMNLENSRVYGLEAEFLFQRSLGDLSLTNMLGYTYTYPVEFNSATNASSKVFLKYRRKHSLKIDLGGNFRKFNLGFTLMAKSPILNIDDVFLNELSRESILPGFYSYWNSHNKAYGVLDMNLGYSISPRFNLSLSVRNLGNTEYMGRPGDIQPQRSYSLRFAGKI
jgi:outer membrane cobalamin receptor